MPCFGCTGWLSKPPLLQQQPAAEAPQVRGANIIAVTTTSPSFQMPLEWHPATALRLRRMAEECLGQSATITGYSTPSTADVGGASLRLRVSDPKPPMAGQGSLALAVRRVETEPWLPAIGGVPGHHKDRNGDARHGLMEIMVIARPTVRGKVTFLPKDVLQQWAPVGQEVEVTALSRLGDFHIDDGSGPWLRDRILITASEAEDLAMTAEAKAADGGIEQLLSGTGLRPDRRVEPPPSDEWDLARAGTLHRDVGSSKPSEFSAVACADVPPPPDPYESSALASVHAVRSMWDRRACRQFFVHGMLRPPFQEIEPNLCK
ncbi:unnamed protein product [Symbiodinium microadriaticum]|nr:unnamed protein product [Symbiodinium sp. KB8]CAE7866681.1 unnamed protein product [Symbiodinium microadriaticum]